MPAPDPTLLAVLQASPAALVEIDPGGRVLSWNRAAELLFGWPATEAVGQVVPQVAPAERQTLLAQLEALSKAGPRGRGATALHRDGRSLEVRLSASAIRGPSGAPRAWILAYLDQREQRTLERALAKRTGELEAIVHSFPDLYFWMSADDRIIDLRAGRQADLFDSPENFVGLKPSQYLPAEAARAIEAAAARARATGEVQTTGYVLPIGGREVPFEGRMGALEDGRVILVVRNVTEHRRMERELRESLELLQTLIESTPDAVFLKDAERRYRILNRAARELAGGNHLGLRDEDFLPPEVAQAARAADDQVIASGRAQTVQQVVPGPTGGRTLLVTRNPLRDPDGRITGIVGIAHDVTEARRLEDQLRQAQKMEAIGRLAGGVAHDFNNLLTVILSSAELLGRHLVPGSPPALEARQIGEAAERAAELTRQLLAFSRRRVARAEVVDLAAVTERLRKMLGRLIGEDIRIELEAHPGRARVLADPGQIEQILVNLVVNARDAMPGGGVLRLHTDAVQLEPRPGEPGPLPPGRYAVLEVTDTGEGMPEDVMAQAFEPFFTTKAAGHGTGLGLSTVYGIVRQLGGHVELSSRHGTGTRVRVLLPETSRQPESAPTVPSERALPGHETVLLVEDEAAVRRLALRILEAQGYTVLQAPDGVEAVRVAESHAGPIHLLLTDVVMPGSSGREVAEWVSARHPEAAVLFMTGFSTDEVLGRRVAEAGARLLEKPFTVATLSKAVREALNARPDDRAPPTA